jgi:aspartyl-tRNA(Asn)/glutamyl-tRNA(Gln) amidotransferase subunit A
MHNLTVAELIKGLKNKDFSSLELTQHYLNRINNSELNAFISITEDEALSQAKDADKKITQGDSSILTGIPYAHKDIFCTKGVKTSAGSKMLDSFISPYDATVTKRLNNENMVMLGKTNMDEFAMGSSNENSYFGPVKNPWDVVKFQEDPQAAQQQLLQRVSHRLQQELIQGEVSANQQVFVELLG